VATIQVPDSSSTAAGAVGRRAGEGGGSATHTHTHVADTGPKNDGR